MTAGDAAAGDGPGGPGPGPAQARPQPKRTRTRTGCLNCRRKKRKCDESRPSCGACLRRGHACEWGLKVTFRAENAQHLDESHPSMRLSARHFPREFKILDVTAEIIRDYDTTSPMWELYMSSSSSARCERPGVVTTARSDSSYTLGTPVLLARGTPSNAMPSSSLLLGQNASSNLDIPTPQIAAAAHGVYPASQGQSMSPASVQHSDGAVASLIYLSQGGERAYTSQAEPSATISIPRATTVGGPGHPGTSVAHFLDHGVLPPPTPEGVAVDDGVFLPGSAYHELHSTLRSRLIQEGMSTAPSRQDTPVADNESDAPDPPKSLPASDSPSPSQSQPPILSSEVECRLWRNWFDEIAPWLDKFDNKRHFQHIIPTMASSHEHLRYAILALSARQTELVDSQPTDKSLALYQEAIHALLPRLPSRGTAVIASCVVLCVLEMLSCSPKAWQRHLDGCASLMEAVGIDGCSGGVEQALFWTFARMAVCGGLISEVKTLIPVNRWVRRHGSGGGLGDAAALFRRQTDFASWANYAVYLLAQVIDLLMPAAATSPRTPPSTSAELDDSGKGRARWLELWEHVCGWHDGRPEPLLPVLTIPSSDHRSPFPTILFSNPAAISGNQLYHTASILMLQNQPRAGSGAHLLRRRSVLWHARRVCAISISNHDHGAWTNSVQPLWIAGRCMSNPAEHRAILTLLARIERESGWGTSWRAEDLKAYWGDLGE
ncbi:Zn(2)-C6 fungal-type DNA-binding domain protein [Cordyceps fumosorosea ARSEF 2679]|uniref:Zn(2)-C6 fungal-type DNA-binding domain protein n=1 Tax=Cordyceps fumosorosea (strain ARSEF 2679) TaxID=1081104 RepID=A0A167MQK8_CORFA|nr:Zn(2)-C6 fungal-type DNA-binding domain protein [Cordyceps fumosorosea ARSEF 2679]OAA54649.1 Zn(2)-C6 fungal-type DNA-binding domain protein [Cordyceps fumosorosea ARSEF 2679]